MNRTVSRKRKYARNAIYVRDVTSGVHPGVQFCTQTCGGYSQLWKAHAIGSTLLLYIYLDELHEIL